MADEQKGTEYVILKAATRTEEHGTGDVRQAEVLPIENTFTVVDDPGADTPLVVRAPNDLAAIKAAEKATGQKFDHGAVAVPSRSWRPRVPKDEMVPRRLWT